MTTIISVCSLVLAGFAACLLAPLVVGMIGQDLASIEGFGLVAICYLFLAAALILTFNGRHQHLGRGQMFMLACCCWLTLVLAAVVPFMVMERLSLAAAWVEAVSAATTLGSTLVATDSISTPMKTYRAIVGWYGGFLTLAMIVYVLSPYSVGGLPNRDLRFVLHTAGENARSLVRTLAEIFVPYATLTVLCLLVLLGQGVRPLDAVLASTAALSTNGFLPTLSGGSIFNNANAEVSLMVFMMVGGTSIIWHRMIVFRRFELLFTQHKESFATVGIILVLALIMTVSASVFGVLPKSAISYLFDTASLMTTTGISHNANTGLSIPLFLALMLGMGGATTFSTSGGIKVYRLGLMMFHSIGEARHLMSPHAVIAGLGIQKKEPNRTVNAVWSHFYLFIITLAVGIIGFASFGLSFETAMAFSVGSINSVGNLVDPTVLQSDIGLQVGLWVSVLALVGRVEILVIIAAIASLLNR